MRIKKREKKNQKNQKKVLTRRKRCDNIYKLSRTVSQTNKNKSLDLVKIRYVCFQIWKPPQKNLKKPVDKHETVWYDNQADSRESNRTKEFWRVNKRSSFSKEKPLKKILKNLLTNEKQHDIITKLSDEDSELKKQDLENWTTFKQTKLRRLKLIYLRKCTFTDASDFVLKRTVSNFLKRF